MLIKRMSCALDRAAVAAESSFSILGEIAYDARRQTA
jgi:hypothetical protein